MNVLKVNGTVLLIVMKEGTRQTAPGAEMPRNPTHGIPAAGNKKCTFSAFPAKHCTKMKFCIINLSAFLKQILATAAKHFSPQYCPQGYL